MRRFAPLLLATGLAACSGDQHDANAFDVANAARAAQSDIDNYAVISRDKAAAARKSWPRPVPTPPRPTATPSGSLAATPFASESVQGAANVVRAYYALLEKGRYYQAWRLWDDEGRASGMSAAEFAASFAKYREHHAKVGAPGRVEAGAGQRYMTLPVEVYGTLKDGGRPFRMEGTMTLHRTGDIDGASEAQRSWRISASVVRPRLTSATPSSAPSDDTR